MLKPGFYNIDCLEAMRQFPDGFFDLAVVDPPYGDGNQETTRTGGTWAGKYGTTIKSWDKAPGEEYFLELFRVAKHQIIWGGELLQTPAGALLFDME